MKAMVFEKVGRELSLRELPLPEPGAGHVRVRVLACAVGAALASEAPRPDFLASHMDTSVDPGVDFFEYATTQHQPGEVAS